MISVTLTDIAKATNGTLFNTQTPNNVIGSVCTDSRNVKKGCLFIALQGENFDAHQFIKQVEAAGAGALVVTHEVDVKLPYILVKDTRIALGLLSAFVKQKISNLRCAAITGSNGKTTTKELLCQILRQLSVAEDSVLATAGNFNNDIGLPLTLLRLTEQSKFAVVELGANHIGEIAYTANLAKPDVALINNVLPAHLEGFGSLDGVAKAKGEIWSSLTEQGTAVVNLDSDFAQQYIRQLKLLKIKTLTFSQCISDANLFASDISFNPLGGMIFTLNINDGKVKQDSLIHLNLPGKHNVSNALAAAAMAVAFACEVDMIQRGLQSVNQVGGRVNLSEVNERLSVIDDTYNANPASVQAAIDLLIQYKGERLLVLGDMAELGSYGERSHIEIGEYAALQGVDKLLTVGCLSENTSRAFFEKGGDAQHFNNKQELHAYLAQSLLENNTKKTILVKGSRSAKMEETVDYIKQL